MQLKSKDIVSITMVNPENCHAVIQLRWGAEMPHHGVVKLAVFGKGYLASMVSLSDGIITLAVSFDFNPFSMMFDGCDSKSLVKQIRDNIDAEIKRIESEFCSDD